MRTLRKKKNSVIIITLLAFILPFLILGTAYATGTEATGTDIAENGVLQNFMELLFGNNAETIDIVLFLTILSLLPSILIMLTGFTRIIIVLSFIRNALGMQQMPPNQVLIGLALFLTFFVMAPVFNQVHAEAYVPYQQGQIDRQEFVTTAFEPFKDFMMRQIYDSDLGFFRGYANIDSEIPDEELPNSVIIPSFITSEIKRAFQIGFFIYIPFIVMDMVVASTLMSMGMMMLPPAMISLPFKVLLFVIVDGWQLTISTLISSFQ